MYKKSEMFKKLRHEMEVGNNYEVAWRRTGVRSEQTFLNWRKSKKSIERYVQILMGHAETFQIAAAESKLFKVGVDGSIRALETFLFNRAPNRWKRDNSDLLKKGEGVTVNVNVTPQRTIVFRGINDKDRDDIRDIHAGEGAPSNRIAGALQSP